MIWSKQDIRNMLEDAKRDMDLIEWEGKPYLRVLLGTWMDFDPCGRYHSPLSQNNPQKRCEMFWKLFNEVAEEMGGWLSDSEGDFCDVVFSLPAYIYQSTSCK